MTATTTKERPVNTILSGPVGGVVGGTFFGARGRLRATSSPSTWAARAATSRRSSTRRARAHAHQGGRGLPAAHADGGHRDDRRRRRQHRPRRRRRRPQGGPAERRRRTGPGLLPAWRRPADRLRRRTWWSACSARTPSSAATSALDADAARAAVERDVAGAARHVASRKRPPASSPSPTPTCCGAIRVITVEKGLDPRDFALVAFGGAGPMHACARRPRGEHPPRHRAAAPGHHLRRRAA